MSTLVKACAYLGLGLSLIPSMLVFAGWIDRTVYQGLMIAGLVLWFGAALIWIKPDRPETEERVGDDDR